MWTAATTAFLNPHIYTSEGKSSQYNYLATVYYLTASVQGSRDRESQCLKVLAFLMPVWMKIFLMLIFVAEKISSGSYRFVKTTH